MDQTANDNHAEPQALMLAPCSWVPNNRRLPVLIYRAAITGDGDLSQAATAGLERHGWTGIWRNGVFSYHHFHAEAHEVLACSRGEATLIIGGPDGTTLHIAAGDVIVLPAGTGHCRQKASRDFTVIGAYPPGQQADMRTGEQPRSIIQTIDAVALPATDPLYGAHGPLLRLWR